MLSRGLLLLSGVAIFGALESCTQAPSRPVPWTDCTSDYDTGPCMAMMYRFYYDQDAHTCKEFVYGGCGGNDNRFLTKEECKQRCSVAAPKSKVKGKQSGDSPADKGRAQKMNYHAWFIMTFTFTAVLLCCYPGILI